MSSATVTAPAPLRGRALRRAWAEARDLAGLRDRTVRWLAGELEDTPGHSGGPMQETAEITDDLIALNRGGFLTTNSQPSSPVWPWGHQDAWVMGYVEPMVAEQVTTAARAAGLDVEVNRERGPGSRAGRRRSPEPALLDEVWGVRSWVSDDAWDALCGTVLLDIRDPQASRKRHLWDTLREALGVAR